MAVKSSITILGDKTGEGWYHHTVTTEKFTLEECVEEYMAQGGRYRLDMAEVISKSTGVYVISHRQAGITNVEAVITKQSHVTVKKK